MLLCYNYTIRLVVDFVKKNNKQVNKTKSFIWNSIGMITSSIISFILLIFVTRINGIDNSGIFSYLFSLSFIVFTFITYGGRIYQISDYNDEYNYDDYYSTRYITTLIGLAFSIIYVVVFNYSIENIVILFSLLGVKILDCFSDVIYGTLQKNDRLDIVGKSLTFKAVFSTIGFIGTNYIFKSMLISTIVFFIINLVIFIIYDLFNEKKYSIHCKKITKKSKQLIIQTRYIVMCAFISTILANVPRFIGKTCVTDTELGYIGILIMIPTVLSLAGQLIIQPSLIDLTNFYNKHDKKSFINEIKKSFMYVLFIAIICVICSYFFGVPVLEMLYNVDFSKYKFIFITLIIGGIFNVVSFIIMILLNIFRKLKIQLYAYIIILILSVLITKISFNIFGYYGIYYGFLIYMYVEMIVFIGIFIYFWRKPWRK